MTIEKTHSRLTFEFCSSPNTRLQERWNTWHEYANQLASNMRDLHEKMCSAVFTDMIAHLKIVNEMLNVEVSFYWSKSIKCAILKMHLARKNRRRNRGSSSTTSGGLFEYGNQLT